MVDNAANHTIAGNMGVSSPNGNGMRLLQHSLPQNALYSHPATIAASAPKRDGGRGGVGTTTSISAAGAISRQGLPEQRTIIPSAAAAAAYTIGNATAAAAARGGVTPLQYTTTVMPCGTTYAMPVLRHAPAIQQHIQPQQQTAQLGQFFQPMQVVYRAPPPTTTAKATTTTTASSAAAAARAPPALTAAAAATTSSTTTAAAAATTSSTTTAAAGSATTAKTFSLNFTIQSVVGTAAAPSKAYTSRDETGGMIFPTQDRSHIARDAYMAAAGLVPRASVADMEKSRREILLTKATSGGSGSGGGGGGGGGGGHGQARKRGSSKLSKKKGSSPNSSATRQAAATASASPPPISDGHDDRCYVCGNYGELLMCEYCPRVYHLHCADPPLSTVPEDDWVCHICLSVLNQVGGIDDATNEALVTIANGIAGSGGGGGIGGSSGGDGNNATTTTTQVTPEFDPVNVLTEYYRYNCLREAEVSARSILIRRLRATDGLVETSAGLAGENDARIALEKRKLELSRCVVGHKLSLQNSLKDYTLLFNALERLRDTHFQRNQREAQQGPHQEALAQQLARPGPQQQAQLVAQEQVPSTY